MISLCEPMEIPPIISLFEAAAALTPPLQQKAARFVPHPFPYPGIIPSNNGRPPGA